MVQKSNGYSPNSFTIKKGVPVKWIITSQDANTCAASLVVPKLGIKKMLTAGKNTIEFTPNEVGTIRFSCSMGMFTGSFNVVESVGSAANPAVASPVSAQAQSCGSGGGCGCGAGAKNQSKKLLVKPTFRGQSSFSKPLILI